MGTSMHCRAGRECSPSVCCCVDRARHGKVGEMKHNRSVPPATVVPVLSYPDVRAAVAWLSAAFGFAERG